MTPAEILAAHRSQPYADLAAACAHVLPPDLTGVLVNLHVVRAAALRGEATDPWVASPEQFRSDRRRHGEAIRAAEAAGSVQFTEPLRMTDLLPGLLIAARRYPGLPLRLIELGACAGLLLVPEAYRITYPHSTWSPQAARTQLTAQLDVPQELLDTALHITDRLGLDLSPVDPGAPGSYDHLRSFAWAGDPSREPRLASALSAVAQDPPEVMRADATVALPDVLADRVERDVVTVVIESGLSAYLSPLESLRLGRTLDAMAGRGPLMLISRSAAGSGTDDLPTTTTVLDLGQRWRRTYAATDLLSERTRWIAPRSVAELTR